MVRLSNCISPAFKEVHRSIKEDLHTHYWLKGGRGSTKSSFWAVELVLGIKKDPDANAICYRKVGDTSETSTYSQVIWAINKLEVEREFRLLKSPLQIVYKKTGQRILFKGLDKAAKSKSMKLPRGYFKYVVFEELDEFDGMEEIRKVTQSLLRGGTNFKVFYSYNPPQNINSWVNTEALIPRADRLIHHSTYLDVPPEWLGEQFFIEADHLKTVNELAYRHEYLGEATGTGGNIFTNVEVRQLSPIEIDNFRCIREGIDWGYAVDPFAWGKVNYDRKKKTLYIFDEIVKPGLLNDKAIELVKEKHYQYATITADSEEPKSIDEFKRGLLPVVAAEKGKDSVRYGIKFLQKLEKIIIDPVKCPVAAREFVNYELERNKDGSFKDEYPDKNNHTIDLVRYALEKDMQELNSKPEVTSGRVERVSRVLEGY